MDTIADAETNIIQSTQGVPNPWSTANITYRYIENSSLPSQATTRETESVIITLGATGGAIAFGLFVLVVIKLNFVRIMDLCNKRRMETLDIELQHL